MIRGVCCLCIPALLIGLAGSEKPKTETVKLDKDAYRVEWLHHEKWDAKWSTRWVVEGDAEVKVRVGKLWVNSIGAEKARAATIWYKEDLPDNIIIRFKARVLRPEEKNAANLNVFLHARELDGKPLEFGRSGVYTEYHRIRNYIVTLTGGVQPGWSRVRRDPGFNMINESEVRSEVGKEYEIAVTVQNGRIRYYLNGKRCHDVTDPKPLPGGKFALRTWSTNAWWDDVEIGKIK